MRRNTNIPSHRLLETALLNIHVLYRTTKSGVPWTFVFVRRSGGASGGGDGMDGSRTWRGTLALKFVYAF